MSEELKNISASWFYAVERGRCESVRVGRSRNIRVKRSRNREGKGGRGMRVVCVISDLHKAAMDSSARVANGLLRLIEKRHVTHESHETRHGTTKYSKQSRKMVMDRTCAAAAADVELGGADGVFGETGGDGDRLSRDTASAPKES